MSISSITNKKLLCDSGGYCQNPSCNKYLFNAFGNGDISSIEERAHIIAKQNNGPRGQNGVGTEKDNYENIIILCPNCHTEVDKNPSQYPVDLLLGWKKKHFDKISKLFVIKVYDTKEEVRQEYLKILNVNQRIFEEWGPESEHAEDPFSDAVEMWEHLVKEKIIPNNNKIIELCSLHEHFLAEDDKEVLEEFKQHHESFVYNHCGKERLRSAKKFPQEMRNMFS